MAENEDEIRMRLALDRAHQAAMMGEVPIGAVLFDAQGALIADGFNRVESLHDATAHAEIQAIRAGMAARGDWRLSDCTLYVTKEPCAMCAGALVNARLKRLVFGCPDSRSGGAGGALDITNFPGMLHQVEITGGILAEECLAEITGFFRRRRAESKQSSSEEETDGGPC